MAVGEKCQNCLFLSEFYDRVDGDMHMGFGGLHGRGAKAKDPPIERDLALSLEEVYHGCVKKMKISRRVCITKNECGRIEIWVDG